MFTSKHLGRSSAMSKNSSRPYVASATASAKRKNHQGAISCRRFAGSQRRPRPGPRSTLAPGETYLSPHVFRGYRLWQDSLFVAFFEELCHGGAAARAVIERPIIHIHADEAVR